MSERIFVAYPFRPDAQATVDAVIRPVLQNLGLSCVTGHEKTRGQREFLDGLRASISSCSALVAIVSGRNPNVFFEIGMASTMGKPCLLLAAAESDAAMLQSIYPIICIEREEQAALELARHLGRYRPAATAPGLNLNPPPC